MTRLAMCILVLALASTAVADTAQLLDHVRSDELSLILLLQVAGDISERDDDLIRNGFRVTNLRVGFKGELEDGFGYVILGSFVKSPALLDAAGHLRLNRALRVRAGAFKSPFSAEFLTPAGNLDFRQRSQAATLLSPGRQVGVQLDGSLAESERARLRYAAGLFNGNGLAASNDDENVLSALRVSYARDSSDDEDGFDLGVNVVHSRDANAPLGATLSGSFFATGFSGERVLGGVDATARRGSWKLGVEILGGRFFPEGGVRVDASGYQATLGHSLNESWELLLRWDTLRARGLLEDSSLLVAGVNVEPRPLIRLQLNAYLPVEGDSGARVGASAQLAF